MLTIINSQSNKTLTILRLATCNPPSYSARYTFSGKERDEETGYSCFGARYYNSAYSIWLSVDPMSDKYPNLSPYVYCANNPVKLVDPSGEEIWIIGEDGQKYQYKNRALVDRHGIEITVNSNSYEGKVLQDLNVLASSKDKRITDRLRDLETSKYKHTISISKMVNPKIENSAFPKVRENSYKPKTQGGGTGSTIYFNHDYEIIYQDGADFYAPSVLAHELLGHGWDYDQGLNTSAKTSNDIPYKEVNAVNIQNIILREHGFNSRTQYGIGDPTRWEIIPKNLLNTYFTSPISRP